MIRASLPKYPELIINLMVSMSTKVLVMHANLSETGGGTAVKQVSLFFVRAFTSAR